MFVNHGYIVIVVAVIISMSPIVNAGPSKDHVRNVLVKIIRLLVFSSCCRLPHHCRHISSSSSGSDVSISAWVQRGVLQAVFSST
jgi:hypothetical protein